jgi:hypothetical protein
MPRFIRQQESYGRVFKREGHKISLQSLILSVARARQHTHPNADISTSTDLRKRAVQSSKRHAAEQRRGQAGTLRSILSVGTSSAQKSVWMDSCWLVDAWETYVTSGLADLQVGAMRRCGIRRVHPPTAQTHFSPKLKPYFSLAVYTTNSWSNFMKIDFFLLTNRVSFNYRNVYPFVH